MLKIKLFAAFAFLACAACAFLFSSSHTNAQTSDNDKKRDEVLEKVAGYKAWKQVQKPENNSLELVKSGVLTITDSSIAG